MRSCATTHGTGGCSPRLAAIFTITFMVTVNITDLHPLLSAHIPKAWRQPGSVEGRRDSGSGCRLLHEGAQASGGALCSGLARLCFRGLKAVHTLTRQSRDRIRPHNRPLFVRRSLIWPQRPVVPERAANPDLPALQAGKGRDAPGIAGQPRKGEPSPLWGPGSPEEGGRSHLPCLPQPGWTRAYTPDSARGPGSRVPFCPAFC